MAKETISGNYEDEDAEVIRRFKSKLCKNRETHSEGLLRLIKEDLKTKET